MYVVVELMPAPAPTEDRTAHLGVVPPARTDLACIKGKYLSIKSYRQAAIYELVQQYVKSARRTYERAAAALSGNPSASTDAVIQQLAARGNELHDVVYGRIQAFRPRSCRLATESQRDHRFSRGFCARMPKSVVKSPPANSRTKTPPSSRWIPARDATSSSRYSVSASTRRQACSSCRLHHFEPCRTRGSPPTSSPRSIAGESERNRRPERAVVGQKSHHLANGSVHLSVRAERPSIRWVCWELGPITPQRDRRACERCARWTHRGSVGCAYARTCSERVLPRSPTCHDRL